MIRTSVLLTALLYRQGLLDQTRHLEVGTDFQDPACARMARELPQHDDLEGTESFLRENGHLTISQVQRVAVACALECPKQFCDILRALYSAFWAEGRGVQLPEVFTPILQELIGHELTSKVVQRVCKSNPLSLLVSVGREGPSNSGSFG